MEWRANKPALKVIDTDKTYTWREFNDQVNCLANAFADRGIRKGDRIGLVLYNTVEFPVTLYACYKLGALPVPVNYMLAENNVRYIIDDMRPEMVVYDSDTADIVESALDATDSSPHRVSVGVSDDADESYASLADSGGVTAPSEVPLTEGDPAYILYTSGTTGAPKGVTYTVQTGYSRAQEGSICMGLSQDSVALQVSPWFHAGGVDLTVHPTVASGGTLLVTRDWEPKSVADLIESEGITHLVGVPTVAQRMAQLDDIGSRDLSSLECLLCMGSPLSRQLAETLMDTITPNVYNGYGTTETLLDTVLRPEDLPEKAGTAGRPSPDKRLRLVNSDREVDPSKTVPPGEEGEVIVTGDAVMDYYFGSQSKTDESIQDGWYRSNDLGVIDKDGYLTITGRADDMILSGGELVSPIEVEETLEEHPKVEESIVVGRVDEEWGQQVTAFVVAEKCDAEELEKYCKEHDSLANYKRPRKYNFVEQIERTATGKKQRYRYRE
ncbi:class I adenylate-forming enzyme family protein [Natrialbaceae archaeon A-gly3]